MSQNKIYVGNLPYSVSGEDLESFFGQYGEIAEAKLIMDRDTGRSKGFAFVTFVSDDSANKALVCDNTEMDGRKIRVNIARDDGGTRRGGGGNGGGGARRGGNGGNGGNGGGRGRFRD
ncbi:MAG TPA: RNA-binding protein [Coxiellaceae bacterium]|nr:RNA-binding protein [Coxiellaceae bacterium]